jgi:co-chaperonin GroES (HSP10)
MEDKRRFDDAGERTALAESDPPKYRIEPRHEWVLIRQHKFQEEITEGGVVKPSPDFFLMNGDKNSQRGIVVAAGPKSDLKEGDFVLFTNYATALPDLEELTGDPGLKLVRDEEVYTRVHQCQ